MQSNDECLGLTQRCKYDLVLLKVFVSAAYPKLIQNFLAFVVVFFFKLKIDPSDTDRQQGKQRRKGRKLQEEKHLATTHWQQAFAPV